jgi:general stress protein 26
MDKTPTPAEALDNIWDIFEKFHVSMLVSHGSAGLHSRPMAPIWRRENGLVWFLTSLDTEKRQEIARNPDVAITLSDGSRHAAMSGTAALVADRTIIRDLWNAGAQAYCPDGPEDPEVIAIKVTPDIGEYWDGPSAPVQMVKMGLALLMGKSADMSADADTAKLDLQTGRTLPQN